jgi:diacylglycerol kinase
MRQKGLNELNGRARSFRYAFDGVRYVLRTQHNAWIHAIITGGVMLLALWLRLPSSDWALLVTMIVLVWTAEFINTALETAVDLIQPQQHPKAKIAKDVAAAAVLLGAAGAVVVGLFVLGPPLWHRLSN